MIRHTKKSGFTLIELLVSMGLLVVMMSIVVANYRNFGTNSKFASASEDVVLALREAQVYGVSTKGYTGGCGGTAYDCRFGVHFTSVSPDANGFVLFVDVNDNRVYDAGTDTVMSQISWSNNISISNLLCGGMSCTSGKVSITFKRPNPDTYIADPAVVITDPGYDTASIILTDSSSGATATVMISSAGQISLN
ncbi:MAG: type II secretion system protein [Candidatus Pacebacteria bacterium]|nr:type II secretion system protein [Candidatus Paceibacterota bacterium]